MRVIPQELCSLADDCLSTSQEVSDARTRGAQLLDPGDAGNIRGGFAVVAALQRTTQAADAAIGRLVSVLERDVDSLYLAAFAFSNTDEQAASSMALPAGVS